MSSGQTRIYKEQFGPASNAREVFASGARLLIEAGASFTMNAPMDLSAGQVTMPGNLARGYAPLVARGVKTTATASGIVTAWTTAIVPKLTHVDVTGGPIGYTWATANVNQLFFEPWRIPDDLSTAVPMRVHYNAESASGATNDIAIRIHGNSTVNLGATGALTTTPTERAISVASGSVPTSGVVYVSAFPGTHATGTVTLFSVGISYGKKTS